MLMLCILLSFVCDQRSATIPRNPSLQQPRELTEGEMAFFLKQACGSKHHKANGGVQETNELLVGIEVWGNVDAVKAPATYATPPPCRHYRRVDGKHCPPSFSRSLPRSLTCHSRR